MTTRRKAATARLRIVQVRSQIGNQERVKRVLMDGLGLGRIGSSVVLIDNSYTRGMIAKVAHIVRFEELAAEPHAPAAEEHVAAHEHVPAPEEAPVRKREAEAPASEKPAAHAPVPAPEEAPARKHEAAAPTPEKPAKAEKPVKAEKPARAAKAAKPAKAAAPKKKATESKPKAGAKPAVRTAKKRPAKKGEE
jgi:ribosomal protein L30